MFQPDDLAIMARAVKLLADRGRLAILGRLADRPQTVDEVAAAFDWMSVADIERRVRMLVEADWVAVDDSDRYALRPDALTALRAAVARTETSRPANAPSAVLKAFFDSRGRLRSLPVQRARRELVLRHIADRCFAPGHVYTERDVTEMLAELYDDHGGLRRALVASALLVLTPEGYTRVVRRAGTTDSEVALVTDSSNAGDLAGR